MNTAHRALFLVLVLTSGVAVSLFAAEIYPKPASQKSHRALDAHTLIAALDTLLAEERQLLQATEEIKQELAIVKVRASSSKP